MAALSDVDVRAVFRMKPEDAVAYVQQKGLAVSWNWYEVRDAAHAQAFTVAKVARLDVLQDIRDAVEASLEKGWGLGQFKKNLTPILQAKGWWGKQVIVDSDGGAEVAQLGSPRRLETIYRTNIQSAMMAARYQQMLANARFRPYWQYIAVMDGRTRPSHAALHGRVYRYDDPIWHCLFPPNGYNCRCRVVALSERDMKAKGLALSSSAGQLVTRKVDAGIDPRTGEVYRTEQTGIRLVHDGKPIVFYPDVGFNYNHGNAAFDRAVQVLTQKVEFADPELGVRTMQASLRFALPRLSADFYSWASNVLAAGQASNNYRVVGALTVDVLDALHKLGVKPRTAALTIRDTDLLHLARDSKMKRPGAVPFEEILSLPGRMAVPQAVLWDLDDSGLVYVFQSDSKQKQSCVVARVSVGQQAHDATERQGLERNAVRAVDLVKAADLVNAERYQLLAGTTQQEGQR